MPCIYAFVQSGCAASWVMVCCSDDLPNHSSRGRDFELLVLPVIRDVVDINDPFNEASNDN